jgi:hypothetical protein
LILPDLPLSPACQGYPALLLHKHPFVFNRFPANKNNPYKNPCARDKAQPAEQGAKQNAYVCKLQKESLWLGSYFYTQKGPYFLRVYKLNIFI